MNEEYIPVLNRVMTGEEVFNVETDLLNKFLVDKHNYKFKEYVMPDGEIQRWWTGNDESIIIRYKDDRENVIPDIKVT